MGDVQTSITAAVGAAEQALTAPGDWLDAEARRGVWIEARDARTNELDAQRQAAISPNAVAGTHPARNGLTAEAVEVVHRIASDPGRLSRSWADDMMATLGEETYVELVGLTAIACAVDMFSWSTTDGDGAVGEAQPGSPAQVRPDGVGDVGAWVSQTVAGGRANVSRSISLVPETNRTWVGLVDALYSRGGGFADLSWERALSRPQVELVAARTTAEMECFY